MRTSSDMSSEVNAARRAAGFDRPGDIAGKLFGKFYEVSQSDQIDSTVRGPFESLDHLAGFGELSELEIGIIAALEHEGASVECQQERIRDLRGAQEEFNG